jgi:hypothetical protein
LFGVLGFGQRAFITRLFPLCVRVARVERFAFGGSLRVAAAVTDCLFPAEAIQVAGYRFCIHTGCFLIW